MSSSIRPFAGRLETARTARTARTTQTRHSGRDEDNYSLAGPSVIPYSPGQDPHSTYFEEGYRDANPWMASAPNPHTNFSLAKTFPHKIRWNAPRRRDAEPIQEQEKGADEPAPQVPEAQRQRRSVQQGDAGENGNTTEQRKKPISTFSTLADIVPVDSASTLGGESPEQDWSDRHFENEGIQSDTPISKTPMDKVIDQLDPNERPFNKIAAFRLHFQRPLAEWLGTTIYVFIGVSGNLSAVTSESQTGSMQSMYWCWGFAVMLAIYISGGGSGAFLNPAVTIMLSLHRGFPTRRVPIYILVQLLGAFTGALLALAILHHDNRALIASSTGVYIYTQPHPWISNSTAFFTEMLGTAVIGTAILALGDSHNSPPGAGMHAFIIGLLTTTVTMALGSATGGCFNPVRDLGPRLASIAVGYPASSSTAHGNWWLWGPCCATITGALLGGMVYDVCIFKGGESPVNYAVNRYKVEGLEKEKGVVRFFGFKRKAREIEGHANDVAKRLEAGKLG